MQKLYSKQITYWNQKYSQAVLKLAEAQGQDMETIIFTNVAVTYKGRNWTSMSEYWLIDDHDQVYYLPLTDDMPELVKEFVPIFKEFTKLKRERYETDRFISGLLLFSLTPDSMCEVLGDNLYGLIQKLYNERNSITSKDLFHPKSLATFLKKHRKIVQHMQERMVINLIMGGLLSTQKKD